MTPLRAGGTEMVVMAAHLVLEPEPVAGFSHWLSIGLPVRIFEDSEQRLKVTRDTDSLVGAPCFVDPALLTQWEATIASWEDDQREMREIYEASRQG